MHNPYADLVNQLGDLNQGDGNFARRLSELVSINELLTTLNTARTLKETLDLILLTILGEYGCRTAAILIKNKEGWTLGMGKGLRNVKLDPESLPNVDLKGLDRIVSEADALPEGFGNLLGDGGFELIMPAYSEGTTAGLICVGPSMLGPAATPKRSLLSTIADFGGVIIANSLYRDDLEGVNRQLQRRIFQLNTLYEITGAYARCLENEQVFQVLSGTLMGQFFISRSAILEFNEDECITTFQRGLKLEQTCLPDHEDRHDLAAWKRVVHEGSEIVCPSINDFMKAHRLRYVLPIAGEDLNLGLLLLGGRLDGKELSVEDKDFILSLSQQSAVALDNIRLQKEEAEKKRMEKELALAREIQQKLLPTEVPSPPGYEVAVEMRPYYQVGGDFYDFIRLEEGRICFCLADVSGKSLPASMIMSTAQASLRALNSFPGLNPKEVIEKLNLHMWQSTQSNKFITLFYAVLDPVSNTLTYINAGHNHPILLGADKSIQFLDRGGMIIGMFPRATYKIGQVHLDPGTDLLIYTDGLSEVTNQEGEEYGDDRLIENLRQKKQMCSATEAKDAIVNDVMRFSSDSMVDDMTLLLIRRTSDEES